MSVVSEVLLVNTLAINIKQRQITVGDFLAQNFAAE